MEELERELTAEELFQKKIADEFERLKNLPQEEIVFTDEQIAEMEEQAKVHQYESMIVSKIRQKYSVNQELALLRQRDSKPIEYNEYYEYVEQCKLEVKRRLL